MEVGAIFISHFFTLLTENGGGIPLCKNWFC